MQNSSPKDDEKIILQTSMELLLKDHNWPCAYLSDHQGRAKEMSINDNWNWESKVGVNKRKLKVGGWVPGTSMAGCLSASTEQFKTNMAGIPHSS